MRLIDADAAIDALIKWYGCEPSDIGAFENIIEKLPSVQPERKTGRWEEISKNYYNRISGRCSACGWEAHLYEDDVVGMPYCPNCGAKMEGTE